MKAKRPKIWLPVVARGRVFGCVRRTLRGAEFPSRGRWFVVQATFVLYSVAWLSASVFVWTYERLGWLRYVLALGVALLAPDLRLFESYASYVKRWREENGETTDQESDDVADEPQEIVVPADVHSGSRWVSQDLLVAVAFAAYLLIGWALVGLIGLLLIPLGEPPIGPAMTVVIWLTGFFAIMRAPEWLGVHEWVAPRLRRLRRRRVGCKVARLLDRAQQTQDPQSIDKARRTARRLATLSNMDGKIDVEGARLLERVIERTERSLRDKTGSR